MKIQLITALFLTSIFQLTKAEVPSYEPHPVFSATYSVPTNQDLASYATWKLQEVKVVRNGETISAKYTMPSDLLEQAGQEISMTGKIKAGAAFFTMSGDRVLASCSDLGKDSYVCLLKFKKTNLKLQSKEEYFKQLYTDSKEAQKRILVAQTFSADPIGILRIEKQ